MKLKHIGLVGGIFALLYILGSAGSIIATAHPAKASYPAFNWATVPTWADLCAPTGFTPSETKFLATHFAGVNLEGTQGLHGNAPSFDVEANDRATASELKSYNPNLKVLMYFNVQVYLPGIYRADRRVRASWLIPPSGGHGNTLFKQQNTNFRDWLVDTLSHTVLGSSLDGVFLDGASCYKKVNAATFSIMDRLQRRFKKHNKKALILYNGLRIHGIAPGTTLAYLKHADGGMMEHFDFHPQTYDPKGDSPRKLMREMKFIMGFKNSGKILLVKAWPDFYWIDPDINSIPYETLKRRARRQITFPLACFLACAQKYDYFAYSWGYTVAQGALLLHRDMTTVDGRWYPELEHPLGHPLGEPVIHGYQFTRTFEHAKIWVDLKTHRAKILWR